MKINFTFTAVTLAAAGPALAAYAPPAGFDATGPLFGGSAFAVYTERDGRLAVARDNPEGNARIDVFRNVDAAAAGQPPLYSISDPSYRFFGGLAWNKGGLVFAENGNVDAVFYQPSVSPDRLGEVFRVADIPDVADVRSGPFDAYLTSAAGPGANDLYRIRIPTASGSGVTTLLAENFGTGFAGGVELARFGQNEVALVADTNDPNFTGEAGVLRAFDTRTGELLGSIDLAAGGGAGAFDVAAAFDGELIVTTGRTLTAVDLSAADDLGGAVVRPFGTFDDAGAFPTYLEYTRPRSDIGSGEVLYVNGGFTSVGGTFAVVVPEPASLAVMAACAAWLPRRRR